MISYIKGEILSTGSLGDTPYIEILTAGGLGYTVLVTSFPLGAQRGDEIELFIESIYREDSQTLYGFADEISRVYFRKLLGVSGVGPKTALNVVAAFSVDEFQSVLDGGDFKTLSKNVKGMGAKGAKRVILELQGKFDLGNAQAGTMRAGKSGDVATVDAMYGNGITDERLLDVQAALESLGYRGTELRNMLKSAQTALAEDSTATVEMLLVRVL